MADEVVAHAPAKVNLALHVTGRRMDGYHLIDTLVAFTRSGDRIRVQRAAHDSFRVEGQFSASLQDGGENLVTRARDLLRDLAGHGPPVAITLEKNLPVAAGIGGGSSDAAATLRALQSLWRLDLKRAALADAALALGADLPMCISARTLLARGIGEAVEEASGLPPLSIVLVNPGVPVATPAVFAALRQRRNPPLPALPAAPSFAVLVDWLGLTRNDLEQPALSVAPQIGRAITALRANNAALARMSGSGATCFGLFADDADAARAATAIAAAEPSWYVQATRTIEEAHADVTD